MQIPLTQLFSQQFSSQPLELEHLQAIQCYIIPRAEDAAVFIKRNLKNRKQEELKKVSSLILNHLHYIQLHNLRAKDFRINLGADLLQSTREILSQMNFEFEPYKTETILLLPTNYETIVNHAASVHVELLPGNAALIAKIIEENFDSSDKGYSRTISWLIIQHCSRLHFEANFRLEWAYPIPDSIKQKLENLGYAVTVSNDKTIIRLNRNATSPA